MFLKKSLTSYVSAIISRSLAPYFQVCLSVLFSLSRFYFLACLYFPVGRNKLDEAAPIPLPSEWRLCARTNT